MFRKNVIITLVIEWIVNKREYYLKKGGVRMNLQMVEQEIASTFSTYETSMEKRIRYISGMKHFAEYLDKNNIELDEVGESVIEDYANELKSSGYPEVFINNNLKAVRKYFSYQKNQDYLSENRFF